MVAKVVWGLTGNDSEYHIKVFKMNTANNGKIFPLEILI